MAPWRKYETDCVGVWCKCFVGHSGIVGVGVRRACADAVVQEFRQF